MQDTITTLRCDKDKSKQLPTVGRYGDSQRRTTGGERNQFRRLSPFPIKGQFYYRGIGEFGYPATFGMWRIRKFKSCYLDHKII